MRRPRWQRWMLVAMLGALSLTGCSAFNQPGSVLDPAGPVAQNELGLIDSSLFIMVLVFLVVASALVAALIRFRRRPGHPRIPKQTEGDSRLELLWMFIPAFLVALLAIGTVRSTFVLGEYLPAPSVLHIDVTGHQYWWAFSYEGMNITTANQLVIPTGTKVELLLKSADVMHAFWVPRLAGKTALVPGRTNYMWIEASHPGTYLGQCSEFCGTGHADMRLVVVAERPANFSQWTAAMEKPEAPPTTALAQQGMKLFQTETCLSCHTISGTPYAGVVGPNLTHLMMRQKIAGNLLPNTPANLAQWIQDPQKVKPGALMPNLHLNSSENRALVAYLETLH